MFGTATASVQQPAWTLDWDVIGSISSLRQTYIRSTDTQCLFRLPAANSQCHSHIRPLIIPSPPRFGDSPGPSVVVPKQSHTFSFTHSSQNVGNTNFNINQLHYWVVDALADLNHRSSKSCLGSVVESSLSDQNKTQPYSQNGKHSDRGTISLVENHKVETT